MPEPDANLSYFSHPETVADYARAALRVGLWASERVVLERFVPRAGRVLELGCGAGRVAAGMAREGWSDVLATDFSPAMVDAARAVVEATGTGRSVRCEVADATALPYPDNTYDAVVFAFNGLLMIPKSERRAAAMREVARVLKPGGVFVFTGHDRSATRVEHWRNREREPEAGEDEFGDTVYGTPQGAVFIHSAEEAALREALATAGLRVVFSEMRSVIAEESRLVREFSDETRFRVAVKQVGVVGEEI